MIRYHLRRTATWGVTTRERLLSRLRTGAIMGSEAETETNAETEAAAAGAAAAFHVADVTAAIAMVLHYGARVGVVEFPHVLLEIKVAAETFAAQTASERLLVVVSMHVERQIVDLMEGFVAYFALVLLLPRMSQFVVLVVPLLMESFSAKFADPRFVALMDPKVSV